MAHDEGVDTAAAAGQKHARLHNTRPQGTSNIRPYRDSNPCRQLIFSNCMSLSILVEQLRLALPSLLSLDIFCSYRWNLAPLPLSLPNTGKEDRRKDEKGKVAIMAVLAFKVTATAWSSFLIHVLCSPRAQNFYKRLLKR
jgi:hypothetical protein